MPEAFKRLSIMNVQRKVIPIVLALTLALIQALWVEHVMDVNAHDHDHEHEHDFSCELCLHFSTAHHVLPTGSLSLLNSDVVETVITAVPPPVLIVLLLTHHSRAPPTL